MHTIERVTDVFSGNFDLEILHSFKNFPVFMGCVETEYGNDYKTDMTWAISKGSGFIQLTNLIPLDLLYQEQHASAVGDIWHKHAKDFANFISNYRPTSVLEIGGSHGKLSKEYRLLKSCEWAILEPNPAPIEGVDVDFIKGFFDSDFKFHRNIDTFIHSHVFEHIYSPIEFVTNIFNILDEGNKLIFSVPNQEQWLLKKYTNCIDFEHTIFLTEPYIENLLSRHGFRLLQKEYYLDDHSIFYAYVKDSSSTIIDLPKNLYLKNKKIFNDFINYYKNLLIPSLNSQLSKIEGKVFLFGASGFSQYLIEFGLNIDNVVYLLDNDKKKHNKRLYGTNLVVKSPSILKEIDKPFVVLNTGVYDSEIKNDIITNINKNTIFIEMNNDNNINQ